MTDPTLDLDLDDPYVDGHALAAAVGSIVRARLAEHDDRSRDVDRARKRCGAAYEALHEALVVYRELITALVDGAGTDGKYDLEAATRNARALLGLDVVDTPPL